LAALENKLFFGFQGVFARIAIPQIPEKRLVKFKAIKTDWLKIL